jgi:hypothetical protein
MDCIYKKQALHTLSDLILIIKRVRVTGGNRGRVTGGNKGKGFRAGKREDVLEVNGGRALVSFKFMIVYLIERTKHIIFPVNMLLYIRNHKLSWL